MASILDFLRAIEWNSPQAVALIAVLTVLAVLRRWFLLAMIILVLTLGRGLCYLRLNKEVISDGSLTLATVVYVVGAIVVVTLAAVEFFVRE